MTKTEILYYPLIDCDTKGTEKVAMIPTPNGNAVKSQSKMWLEEKFVQMGQLGHLATEFLDGKLVRPEAIKVMRMTDNIA